jgi:hypothetical protein
MDGQLPALEGPGSWWVFGEEEQVLEDLIEKLTTP